MSKALRHMPEEERKKTINRRIKAGVDRKGNLDRERGITGLGFWAAIDARKKQRR